jgi:hypothetical protein
MDLIQENIRIRYDEEDFLIQNCLFGFEAKAEFLVKAKFAGFSFVQKQLGRKPTGYLINVQAGYSY